MTAFVQITLGTLMLLLCTFQHVSVTSGIIRILKKRAAQRRALSDRPNFRLTAVVIIIFLASHTLHLYLWATAVRLLGALPEFQTAIYFALVTYTTTGYGDVTLSEDYRIFGAMASVTGILLIGVTTAFLVSFFSHSMPEARHHD